MKPSMVIMALLLASAAGARAQPPVACEDYVTLAGLHGRAIHVVVDLDRSNWDPSGWSRYVDAEAGAWEESNGIAGLQCEPTSVEPADTELAYERAFSIVPCTTLPIYDPLSGPLWVACDLLFPY